MQSLTYDASHGGGSAGRTALFVGLAVLCTGLFHAGLYVLLGLIQVPPLETSGLKLAPRSFKVSQAPEPQDKPEPGTRSGGILPLPAPGAAAEKQPPKPLPLPYEQAFTMSAPVIGTPPPPIFDPASEPASKPSFAMMPSLLPVSPGVGQAQTGAPSGLLGQIENAIGSDLKKNRFELPSSLPGKAAIEEFAVSEGGGFGAGGVGSGAQLPTFSDIEKLIRADLKDLTINPDGVVIRLSNEVLFDFDSDKLAPKAVPLLHRVAAIIGRYPGAVVTVEGHTDAYGADDYNMKLSERRAQSVGVWLKQAITSPLGGFSMKGFGETKPIANPKGTIAEQLPNRRVEIHVKARKFHD